MVIPGCPNLSASIQEVSHPQISMVNTTNSNGVQTPFSNLNIAGDVITFPNFTITFKLDELMYSYTEIVDWITAVGFPNSFTQFAQIANNSATSGNTIYRDCILTTMDSQQKPVLAITYKNAFPMTLGNLNFKTTDNNVDYITCTVTMSIQSYSYNRFQSANSSSNNITSTNVTQINS